MTRKRLVGLGILILTGCGRLAFEPTDVNADVLEEVDATACTSWGPFSRPTPMAALLQSSVDDWFPTPTLGGHAIAWQSARTSSAGFDLWFATRDTLMEPFKEPTRVVELGSVNDDKSPTLTADDLDLVYGISAGGEIDLFMSTRSSLLDPWPSPINLTTVNSTVNDMDPFMTADGLRLVFASSRATTVGSSDLWEATRTERSMAFSTPTSLFALQSTAEDAAPTLSTDGLEIFFVSRRSGGPGGYDVYTARRPTTDREFGSPQLVAELCSTRDEYGLRLSEDSSTLYLNYDADVAGGNADLWVATRTCR